MNNRNYTKGGSFVKTYLCLCF